MNIWYPIVMLKSGNILVVYNPQFLFSMRAKIFPSRISGLTLFVRRRDPGEEGSERTCPTRRIRAPSGLTPNNGEALRL